MRISRTAFALVLVFLFAVAAPSAKADTIYTYTGNDYATCGGTYCSGGPYALSVKFDTTLTGNALDSLPFTDITATIASFKFTDGSGLTLDNSNNASGTLQIEISTGASGNILTWFVGAYTSSANTQMQTNWDSPSGFIPGADFSETTPFFAGDFGFISNKPGPWGMVTTPEPSTFVLLFVGMGMIGVFRLRKRCREDRRPLRRS